MGTGDPHHFPGCLGEGEGQAGHLGPEQQMPPGHREVPRSERKMRLHTSRMHQEDFL